MLNTSLRGRPTRTPILRKIIVDRVRGCRASRQKYPNSSASDNDARRHQRFTDCDSRRFQLADASRAHHGARQMLKGPH